MKLVVIAFLLLLTPGISENVSVDIPENIKCGAQNCFNPEKWNFFHQWDMPPVTDYIGFDIGCNQANLKTIRSVLTGRSYGGEWLFEYDAKNRLTLQESISSSGNKYTIKITYNQSGKPSSINDNGSMAIITYPSPGHSVIKNGGYVINTTTKGFTVISTRTDKAGRIASKTTKVFDANKRLLSDSSFYSYNTSTTVNTYIYNKKGWVVEKIANFGKDVHHSYRHYNDYGWITLDSTIINNRNNLVIHYTYDINQTQEGTTIQQNRLYTDTSGAPLVYTFNKKGNWVEMKDYSTILPLATETRKITYR